MRILFLVPGINHREGKIFNPIFGPVEEILSKNNELAWVPFRSIEANLLVKKDMAALLKEKRELIASDIPLGDKKPRLHEIQGIINNRLVTAVLGQIFSVARPFQPQIILIQKATSQILIPELLHALKQENNPTIYLWSWDDPYSFGYYNMPMKKAMSYVDVVFTSCMGSESFYKQFGVKKVLYHTFFYTPTYLYDAKPSMHATEIRRFSSDVSFAGHAGYCLFENKFKQVKFDRFKTFSRLIKEPGLGSFKVWGREWNRCLALLPYHQGWVHWHEVNKIYSCTKINLNLYAYEGDSPGKAYMDKRFIQIMGCGGFQLCEYTDGYEELFDIDKELVLFKTYDELVDKTRYYLKNDIERDKIAERGFQKVKRDFSLERWASTFNKRIQAGKL